MNIESRILEKVKKEFSPKMVEVVNNSYLHAGHAAGNGLPLNNQTHFKLIISFSDNQKVNRVEIHRQIKKLLVDEFQDGMHALEIIIKKDIDK